ncbi:MAG: hypothetical protein HY720_00835 [Planctomycetes bacterium]|nr:hypothetical protein [Planctomycetota bacterium]
MSIANCGDLVRLFDYARVGWYFEHDRDDRAEHVVKEAAEVSEVLTARLGNRVDVLAEVLKDPDAFVPLVQTLVMPMTAPIRAMVYCVLRGAKVTAIDYKYAIRSRSTLEVTVEFGPHGELKFESKELWDAEALHHFGFAKLNDAPFVDGYFAFGRR